MLRYEIITKKNNLIGYKKEILSLFFLCFGKELSADTWDWLYIENPSGEPIVSLCFDEKTLIGHYAVIPVPLRRGKELIKSCLSLTTMVHQDYRKHGVFTEGADRVYRQASKSGIRIVIGFPNDNSAPGFRKRLNWNLSEGDYVARLSKKQMTDSSQLNGYLQQKEKITLDLENKSYLQWRLSRPGCRYDKYGTVITKDFQDSKDIVFLNGNFSAFLDDKECYNILLDSAISEFRAFQLFEYRFGFRVLDETLWGAAFKKDLLMSDVF